MRMGIPGPPAGPGIVRSSVATSSGTGAPAASRVSIVATIARRSGRGHDRAQQTVKLEQDLRKGVLVLAVLSRLRDPQYGYSLRQGLAQRGMPIEEGTLYPLLRRLEGQGLLSSEWRIEDGPPRRYYTLSGHGSETYRDLVTAWGSLTSVMDRLLDEES
jgi:DNA-binding PadR family transcriptional regulator